MHKRVQLYALRMNADVRELRCFVAIIDEGSFTDAAIELGMSQAAVSRNLASLESGLGARLVRRTTRSVELTSAGERALPHARRVLAALDDLERDVQHGRGAIHFGYAWSALGRHTVEFQRRWAAANPDTELELVRINTSTAGLSDGSTQFALLRKPVVAAEVELVLIGVERRFCAMATDDPLSKRRSVTLAEIADHTIAIDLKTGTTSTDLWPEAERPASILHITDVDDWLTTIASGRAVGISSEATAHQYRRPGVSYRLLRDAPPIPVYLAWSRSDPPPERTAVLDLLADLYR